MTDDGDWSDWQIGERKGSTLRIGPIFSGEVFYPEEIQGCRYWRAILNSENLAAYPTMEQAKARVDWEIANRLRRTKPAYGKLLARRPQWENGAS